MSTTETETAVPAQDPPAVHDDPSPEFPAPPRRPGTRRARALAILSLVAAFGATGYVVATAVEPAADTPLEEATAPAWEATSALSDALRELRPGGSRNAARPLAGAAAKAVGAAEKRVEALDLPISQTPVRSRVLETLRADAAWIDAVGSTLANPRSPRRAELSGWPSARRPARR
jgi:hypothetical protein